MYAIHVIFWQVKFGVYLCTGGQFLGFVYPGYGQFSYSWLCWDRTSLSASIHAKKIRFRRHFFRVERVESRRLTCLHQQY